MIKIGSKNISYQSPVFITAEAGVNHNGRLDLALKLVDAAVKAGADAIKFQTFKAEQVVTKEGEMAEYQKRNLGRTESQMEMLKKLELKEEFYKPIIQRCEERNIIFLSTPHGSFEAVDFLQELGVPAFKFGSGDLNNLPVLQYAAKFKKPVILSTGMATIKEVKEAIDCIRQAGNSKIIVLHCTTNYPCPFNEVNLRAMQTMMKELDVLVGYSDHALGTEVPIMAAKLGACIIEKHLTLDRTMFGPDHRASAEPHELNEIINRIKRKAIENIRNAEVILGSAEKRPSKSEISMIKAVRKSIVSLRDIKKGEIFSKDNVGIKRPGSGLEPKNYFTLLGKKAKKDIEADKLIKKSDYV